MGIEQFVSFGEVKTGEKPKKKPTPKSEKVEPQVKKKKKVEPKPEKPAKVEKEVLADKYKQEETIRILEKYFENEQKIGKSVYETVYKGKKTILGSLIKSTDKVVSVMKIMGDTIINAKFVSVSPKFITERELKTVAKKFVAINESRRLPLLVEAKYICSEDYAKHRQEVYDQFT